MKEKCFTGETIKQNYIILEIENVGTMRMFHITLEEKDIYLVLSSYDKI